MFYARWKTTGKKEKRGNSKLYVECVCTCGTQRYVSLSSLKSGESISCGCLRREKTTIHGDHLTKLYALWRNFRYRCNCKTSKDFKHYGAKGIDVYLEWEDYTKFKKWALSSGYKEGLVIERKDNAKGYNPRNCIFTTIAENNKNKSNGYWWFVKGKKFKSATDAGEYYKTSRESIVRRCKGYKNKGLYYPPKKDCYAIKKYKENCYANN